MQLIALLAALAALSGCGQGTDTRDVERDVAVEYMPVDGSVLGYWIMQQDKACASGTFCVDDMAPYGNPLYLQDADYAPLDASHISLSAGVVGNSAVLSTGTAQAELVTADNSAFANTVIGEKFAIHVRAKTTASVLQTVLSLGNTGGAAFNISLDQQDIEVEFPNQGKRLLGALPATEWQEIYIASDGNTVSLAVNCNAVTSFVRAGGSPIISNAAQGLMVGARWGGSASDHFTGGVNVVRVAATNEVNRFCD